MLDSRRPIPFAARYAIHLLFGLCLLGTGAYYLRLAQERHVALGIHGTRAQNVLHVRAGSEAERAGIEVGDRLANPTRSWLIGFLSDEPSYTFTTYRGNDTLDVTLNLQQSPSPAARLAGIPPDMKIAAGVGLIALLLGWWVFARNPDDRNVIPFALWSAVSGPYWVAAIWSAYWSFDMWAINTMWSIPGETALQAFAIHWLLVFPTRLVSRRVIIGWYVLMISAVVALFVVALAIEDKPVDLMAWKGLCTSAIAVVLCFVQLRKAPSLKARRQASWVLLGIMFFSLVSFFLWDAPHLAGITLPFGVASAEMIAAASYLAIPVGVAVAITREGLFRIDRFVTRGMALAATLVVIFLLYVSAAYLVAEIAGVTDRSSLPVFWGFAVACGLAVLARPIHVGIEKLLDRFFGADKKRYEAALGEFDKGLSSVGDRRSLERLMCRSISTGLGVAECAIVTDAETRVQVAPGALTSDAYSAESVGVVAMPPGVYVAYPIRVGDHVFGTAQIGPKSNNLRFTDEDLLFLERLSLRCADQSARMELYDEALRRELEFAQTRLRIAADLHDDIGSNLSGIALMTETAAESTDGPARLLEISRFARSMVDSLRDIVWSIDPDSDSPEHLVDRMKDAASSILSGINHTFQAEGKLDGPASPVFQRNVFLIFKEAIHNASRHAQASEVTIRVVTNNDEFVLVVSDNGVGFDTSVASNGLGRKTMARRAERIGGRLLIESAKNSGTTLTLRVRMARTRHDSVHSNR